MRPTRYINISVPTCFWYLYGAGMLFLLSFVIFNDDLKRVFVR